VTKKRKGGFRVKPRSRSERYEKLRSLKCYEEVYKRICAGWPATQLARFIQEERHELQADSTKGLEHLLRDFRAALPAGDLVAKRFPAVFEEAKEALEYGLDELTELEELYRIQMHRIGIDFNTETKINKLMPSMTSEIREARQILESIAELKMDLGIHQRAPEQHDVSVEGTVEAKLSADLDKYPEGVREVLENPESRRRVQGMIGRFLQLQDGEAVAVDGAEAP
jgi:hypothetical protein